MFSILVGCLPGIIAGDFKAYEGSDRLDHELAVIDNWGECTWCLTSVEKGGYLYYEMSRDGYAKAIKLAPGRYIVSIRYGEPYPPDVLFNPRKGWARHAGAIDLQAGHTYTIKTDSCIFACVCYSYERCFLWIEDAGTGEVVRGSRTEAPSPSPVP